MDVGIIRLVVAVLGICGVIAVGFIGFVSAQGREPPAALVLLAGNVIGALVAILVQAKEPRQGRGER